MIYIYIFTINKKRMLHASFVDWCSGVRKMNRMVLSVYTLIFEQI